MVTDRLAPSLYWRPTLNHNQPKPSRRLILLGASNLSRSFPTVVATAHATWREPVEIMAAMGHGRSYGEDTTLFGRKISGIFPCALWQDLQNRPAMPTTAFVTDIGNDLLFGVAPDRLLKWVASCLDRLAEHGAEVTVTQLPIENVERLSEARFQFYRWLFFPRSRMTLDDVRKLARSFNEQLIQLGVARKISVIPVSRAWYGLDPIHLQRRKLRHAWPSMFASWRAADVPEFMARSPWWTAAYLSTLAPYERRFFGVLRRAAQPSGVLVDGTTISLY